MASKKDRRQQAAARVLAAWLAVLAGAAGYVEGTELRIAALGLLALSGYVAAMPLPQKKLSAPKSGSIGASQKKSTVLSTCTFT
ncbi:hypothetical protein GCM10022214_38370 [Actinomadura miaoliensis]|uniref:Uncharacterized protein n=1 Tax=Actinomadura miaoliensis TaxID=430685 RepID=A0ABP7VY35_9ACTN